VTPLLYGGLFMKPPAGQEREAASSELQARLDRRASDLEELKASTQAAALRRWRVRDPVLRGLGVVGCIPVDLVSPDFNHSPHFNHKRCQGTHAVWNVARAH